MPTFAARLLFAHDVGGVAARKLAAQLGPDSARMTLARVSWVGVPADLRRTYVVCTRDRALPPSWQHRQIANLGACDIVTIDSAHDPFFSQPLRLAQILNSIAQSAGEGLDEE